MDSDLAQLQANAPGAGRRHSKKRLPEISASLPEGVVNDEKLEAQKKRIENLAVVMLLACMLLKQLKKNVKNKR